MNYCPQDADTARRVQRWMAISCLALIAATWRLWTPQTEFPQVPAFAILCTAPGWLDWICLVCMLSGLLALSIGCSRKGNIVAYLLVLMALPLSACLDQHRVQPWAYQLWLFASIWLCCGLPLGLNLMRWLLISVYVYSALGKLDYEFLHSVGQQMLAAMARLCGQDSSTIPMSVRLGLVATFPVTELLVGIGLAWPKTRRVAGLLAIGFHVVLVVLLGPLGLNHRLGVLIWNVQFAILAYLLFVAVGERRTARDAESFDSNSFWQAGLQRLCCLWIATVIALPCTERFGLWDHWPSWALYAPHSSRVRIEVTTPVLGRLPAELLGWMNLPKQVDELALEWIDVPIDMWSLQSLGTPIYPQARYQLGVAKHLASAIDSEFDVRLTILSNANRWNGERQSRVFEGSSPIANAGGDYWWNTAPRRW